LKRVVAIGALKEIVAICITVTVHAQSSKMLHFIFIGKPKGLRPLLNMNTLKDILLATAIGVGLALALVTWWTT